MGETSERMDVAGEKDFYREAIGETVGGKPTKLRGWGVPVNR